MPIFSLRRLVLTCLPFSFSIDALMSTLRPGSKRVSINRSNLATGVNLNWTQCHASEGCWLAPCNIINPSPSSMGCDPCALSFRSLFLLITLFSLLKMAGKDLEKRLPSPMRYNPFLSLEKRALLVVLIGSVCRFVPQPRHTR